MDDKGPPFDDDDLINDFNEEDDYYTQEFEDPYMDEPDAGQNNDGNGAAAAPNAMAKDGNDLVTSEEIQEDNAMLHNEEETDDLAIKESDIPDQVMVSSIPIAETKLYSFDRYVHYVDMDIDIDIHYVMGSNRCLYSLTQLSIKGTLVA